MDFFFEILTELRLLEMDLFLVEQLDGHFPLGSLLVQRLQLLAKLGGLSLKLLIGFDLLLQVTQHSPVGSC